MGKPGGDNAFDKMKLQGEILLHEHSSIRDEIIMLLNQYKDHVNLIHITSGAFLGSLSWVILNNDKVSNINMINISISILISILFPLVLTYMFFDVMHTMFSMQIAGGRISTIETRINDI